MSISRVAADIGGPFTDVAAITSDGRVVTRKLPSTPANYADAVIAEFVIGSRRRLETSLTSNRSCTGARSPPTQSWN